MSYSGMGQVASPVAAWRVEAARLFPVDSTGTPMRQAVETMGLTIGGTTGMFASLLVSFPRMMMNAGMSDERAAQTAAGLVRSYNSIRGTVPESTRATLDPAFQRLSALVPGGAATSAAARSSAGPLGVPWPILGVGAVALVAVLALRRRR